jgi:hypothetical protein
MGLKMFVHLLRKSAKFGTNAGALRSYGRTVARPTLEPLEDRLAPTINLTIGPGASPTLDVAITSNANTTTFTATDVSAFLNVADMAGALANGNVVVQTGSPATPNDTIIVSANTTVMATGGDLTLSAPGTIEVGGHASLSTRSGALTLSARAIDVGSQASVLSTEGPIRANADETIVVRASGSIRSELNTIELTASTSDINIFGTVQSSSSVVFATPALEISYADGASISIGAHLTGLTDGRAASLESSDIDDSVHSHTYDISPTGFVRDGVNSILFTNVDSVSVNGGVLDSVFNVVGNATMNFVVIAQAGAGTLNLTQSRPLGVHNKWLYLDGTISLVLDGIRTVNLLNPTGINALYGPNFVDRASAFEGLTAQERFVQALYLDALGRMGGQSELAAWASAFTVAGISQAEAQHLIASGIEMSPEARHNLTRSWYHSYLGRSASAGEEQFWVDALLKGASEESVLSRFLGAGEFYNRAQSLITTGTADQRYIRALYQLFLFRLPAPDGEESVWLARLPVVGQAGVALGIVGSNEFRTNQFQGYYLGLLDRPADPSAYEYWPNQPLDFNAVRLALESSGEFYANG